VHDAHPVAARLDQQDDEAVDDEGDGYREGIKQVALDCFDEGQPESRCGQ
jgi:hypothetical protein